MNKKLSDMTLEELWHLFPIQLISPQKEWRNVYTSMSTEVNRISLNKGYTENGFADEVFYVHIRYVGDNDELYFRDYLNEFVNIRKEYEKLKLSLWKDFEFDRDGYTEAKSEFIKKYTQKARVRYGD